jgi:molecular chaperone GrpE
MFPKKKENPKEEQQTPTDQEQTENMVEKTSLEAFYGLLDKLLPVGRQLAMEKLKKKEEEIKNKHDEEKDSSKFDFYLWLEKEKNSYWKDIYNILFSQYQRLGADYDNYQKRSAKQITDNVAYEKDKIVKSLLPILDNFEYILANTSCGAADETLLKGVQIIYDQMLDVLKGHGIEQVKSAGEQFNPAHHEAITHRSENSKKEGLVLEELQKGYKLNGRLIRASRVIVNKTPAPQTPPQPEEPETKDTQ